MIEQFIIIFGVTYLGEILSWYVPLPIPGTILGMILFFFALYFKLIKVEKIADVAHFLLLNISFFLVAPSVKIINSLEHLSTLWIWLKIIVLMVVTTIITMGVTGRVVQYLVERENNGTR